MTDKVIFIAVVSCFDTFGKLCYYSKRTLCNRSVTQIFDSFETSIIPRVSSRLPIDSKLGFSKLTLFDVDSRLSSGSPNYEFLISY